MLVVVSVKATYQAFAAAYGGVQNGTRLQLYACFGLAIDIKRKELHFGGVAHREPVIGLNAYNHACWPDTAAALQGLYFAVGVAVAGFKRDVDGALAGGNIAYGDLPCAVFTQLELKLVGKQAGLAFAVARFAFVAAVIIAAAMAAAATKAKFVVALHGYIAWSGAG